MYYTIGVSCSFIVITRQCNPIFQNSANRVMNSQVSGQCCHAILTTPI